MTVHKLTAGEGYTYLTRQVAAHDATNRGFDTLGGYYTERGEAAGVWMGSGLAAVPDFPVAGEVSEAQMQALFGEGRHPNARELERWMRAAGASEQEIDAASRLGSPYRIYAATRMFNRRAAGAFRDYNRDQGRYPDSPVPAEDRARMRSEIAGRMFVEDFGREPEDARELSGHLARISRQQTTAVAGYDLTFSPVKSVSTLWAIAPKPVADIIEQAHHDAVTDTLRWIEQHAAYTRVGTNGVAQVETRGLLAAAFTHRDSRATPTCTPTSPSATRCRPCPVGGSPWMADPSSRTTCPPPSGTTPAWKPCSSTVSASASPTVLEETTANGRCAKSSGSTASCPGPGPRGGPRSTCGAPNYPPGSSAITDGRRPRKKRCPSRSRPTWRPANASTNPARTPSSAPPGARKPSWC
jgi:TrwC relaxase